MLGNKLGSFKKIHLCLKPLHNRSLMVWSNDTIFIPSQTTSSEWTIRPPGFLFHFSQCQFYFWISIKTVFARHAWHNFKSQYKGDRGTWISWVCGYSALQSEFQYSQDCFTYKHSQIKTRQLFKLRVVLQSSIPKSWQAEKAKLFIKYLIFEQILNHKAKVTPPGRPSKHESSDIDRILSPQCRVEVSLGSCHRLNFCLSPLACPGLGTASRSIEPWGPSNYKPVDVPVLVLLPTRRWGSASDPPVHTKRPISVLNLLVTTGKESCTCKHQERRDPTCTHSMKEWKDDIISTHSKTEKNEGKCV